MKQTIQIGLRAVILAAILTAAPSTQAQTNVQDDQQINASLPSAATPPRSVTLPQSAQAASPPSTSVAEPQSSDVVKLGVRQSPQSTPIVDEAVARIQAHAWNGRQAATLYVRNIPVLTFLGEDVNTSADVKMGASTQGVDQNTLANDPVERAGGVAAQINQLTLGQLDPNSIKVSWSGDQRQSSKKRDRYTIKVDGKPLVTLDQTVVLAGQKQLREENALQATNRLRRLLGNAAPLTEITGKPRSQPQQVAFGTVRLTVNGEASWYGPGFHGNLSANGERFNQYAMTAAHKSLPFGTRVRVTNLNNGRSVVVRINDRGPYIDGRDIDLSLGAAELIGLTSSGVAPVKLDIMN